MRSNHGVFDPISLILVVALFLFWRWRSSAPASIGSSGSAVQWQHYQRRVLRCRARSPEQCLLLAQVADRPVLVVLFPVRPRAQFSAVLVQTRADLLCPACPQSACVLALFGLVQLFLRFRNFLIKLKLLMARRQVQQPMRACF